MARLITHAFALAVISVALGSAPATTRAVPITSEPDSEPNALLPVQAALEVGALDAAQAATQPGTQAAVTFDPQRGLPHWLHAIRDVALWSTSDSAATAAIALPAGSTYVKPLGPFVDSRVQVYFPGDSVHPAERAWVDTTAVEPSGVPPWIAPPAPPVDGVAASL